MTHKIGLFLGAIVLLAWSPSLTTAVTASQRNDSIELTRQWRELGPSNCVRCSECLAWNEHRAAHEEGGPNLGAHSCIEGPGDCSGHPVCGSGADAGERARMDDMMRLIESVLDGDRQGLTELAAGFPDKVILVPERLAVQVRGCEQAGIMAHIPITREELAALEPVPLAIR